MKRHFVYLFLCLTILLAGCDTGLKIVKMEITEYPHNIVYYVGHDTQLDLSGGEVKLTTRAGYEDFFEMIETEFEITHSIDFNTEGVYIVEIRRTPELYSRFPIQVVQLKNGEE